MTSTAPAPVRSRYYIEPAHLKRVVKATRSRCGMRRQKAIAEFFGLAERIARGLNHRLRFVRMADADDYVQDCLVRMHASGLKNADVDGNLFAYFTAICNNVGRKICNERAAEAAMKAQVLEECQPTQHRRGRVYDDTALDDEFGALDYEPETTDGENP